MQSSLAKPCTAERKIPRVVSLAILLPRTIAVAFAQVHTRNMGKLAGILVFVAVSLGIYYFAFKKMPTTDRGTAPTQNINLTAVRRDLLQIAQAERSNIALSSHCSSIEELISNGSLTMSRPEREGYTYEIQCKGDSGEFAITARHASAPEGSPIRYPNLGTDQSLQISEIQ